MLRKIVKIFIALAIIGAVIYGGHVGYKLGKSATLHMLENFVKAPISYKKYDFNPLSRILIVGMNSKSVKADTLEIKYNLLDLLFRKIALIKAVNLYFNLDTIIKGYSQGKGENSEWHVPAFEISQIIWENADFVTAGLDFKAQYVEGKMLGVNNTLVIPFKTIKTKFLGNTYNLMSSTVKVFKDSTVLYDVQALSKKITVKDGKMKVLMNGETFWWASFARYDSTVLHEPSGVIKVPLYIVRAKKSMIIGKYSVDSLDVRLSSYDFDTLHLKSFAFYRDRSSLLGSGSLSHLKYNSPDSVHYDLNLRVSNLKLDEARLSGDIILKGKGYKGRFNAHLRNVSFREYAFRQLNLTSSFHQDTLFISFGEINDPNLYAQFSGLVSKDSTVLAVSGNGYDIGAYVREPLRTNYFEFKGDVAFTKESRSLNIRGMARGASFENMFAPEIALKVSYDNGNIGVDLKAVKFALGKFVSDSTCLTLNLSAHHMGNYHLGTYFPKIWLRANGNFYLDSSGLYLANKELSYRVDSLEEVCTSPVYLTLDSEGFSLKGDSMRLFSGVLSDFDLTYTKDSVSASGRLERINLKYLRDVMPAFAVKRGLVDGQLSASGPLENPSMNFKGKLYDATLKNLEIDTIRAELIYENGQLMSPITVVKGKGFSIYSDFVLPAELSLSPFKIEIDKDRNIHGELSVERVDATVITRLIGGDIYPESGELKGNLLLTGTLNNPELAGNMELKTDGVYIEAFGNEYRQVFVRLDFKDKRVEIPDIRIDAQNGYATGSGVIYLKELKPSGVNISLELVKFPFAHGDIFEGIFNGQLKITGELPDNVLISGDIKVDEGYVYLSFGKSAGSGKMPPNPLRLNLRIHADRRIFLVNELADMEFSADLTIVKEDPVTVLISGNLNVIKGTFLYLDRIFIIQEGSIIFSNEPEINPTLNLLGETVVNDTIFIDLHVTGNLKTPEIRLTSTPPLAEEDIISLLSFGKLLSEVPMTIKDINLMKTRALNLAEGLISKELQKRLRINELELRTGLAGENPRFSVGLYLSPRVYFKYAHSFEALEKDVYQVKYFIKPNMAIYGERDKEGEISVGIEARFRF